MFNILFSLSCDKTDKGKEFRTGESKWVFFSFTSAIEIIFICFNVILKVIETGF